jgi:hypothetical protein
MYRKKLALLLLFAAFSTSVFAQEREAVIRILQDQAIFLNDFQTTVKLKKKQFRFQVALRNCDGVYVFASISDSVYRFTEFSPIQDFSYLKLLQLRDEDIFNTNKELNYSETGWSYWFYNPQAEWYPFNRKVTYIDTNEALCTKVIRQLYDVDERKVIRLKDVNTPLYLFFIAVAEYDVNGKPIRELMRKKLKIEWDDED